MRRRRLFRLLAVVIGLLVALVLGEVAFRTLRGESSVYAVAATGNQYHFYQFDPELGWANAPGAVGTFKRDEFSYDVSVNEHGMRQGAQPLGRVDGKQRIAVLGDSFVWGIGVSDQDRFTEQLADRLVATEVLNFGVSGYGPVQQLLSLDRVLAFEPDLVVSTICLGNDLIDDVQHLRYGYYKPYARLTASGALDVVDDPLPELTNFGFQQPPRFAGSEMLGALWRTLVPPPQPAGQAGLMKLTEAGMYDESLPPDAAAEREQAITINRLVLAAIRDRVEAAGSRYLVLAAPTKFEYHPEGKTGNLGVFPVLEQAVQRNCKQAGIDFLPMVQHLDGTDFWQRDGHWAQIGHRKVAAALASGLAERGFRRRQ